MEPLTALIIFVGIWAAIILTYVITAPSDYERKWMDEDDNTVIGICDRCGKTSQLILSHAGDGYCRPCKDALTQSSETNESEPQ